MPTITTPDGRKIPIPQGATDDEIDSLIFNDAYYNNPDWPKQGEPESAPPGGVPPATVPGLTPPEGASSVEGELAASAGVPAPEPDPFAPEDEGLIPIDQLVAESAKKTDPQQQAERLAIQRQVDADAMPWYKQGAIGVGQSLVDTGQGISQLKDYLLHGPDSPEYKESLAAEKESRVIDDAILSTGAGRTGQVLGHVGQALLPGAGAAKLAAAGSKGLTLGRLIAAEAGAGALSGAVAPVKKGESRANNMATSAALSAVGAAPLQTVGAITKTLGGPKVRALMDAGAGLVKRLGGGDEAAAKLMKHNRDNVIGPQIGELTERFRIDPKGMAVFMKPGKHLPAKIKAEVQALRAQVKNMVNLSPLKGKDVQQFREDIGAAIDALKNAGKTGAGSTDTALEQKALERLRRNLDKGVEASITPKQSKKLKELYTHYGAGTVPRTWQDEFRAGALPAILTGGEKSRTVQDMLFGGPEYEEYEE